MDFVFIFALFRLQHQKIWSLEPTFHLPNFFSQWEQSQKPGPEIPYEIYLISFLNSFKVYFNDYNDEW